MRLTRNDFITIGILSVCAVICTVVTVRRADRSVEPIAWYGPMPHPYITEVSNSVAAASREMGVPVYQRVGQEWSQDTESQAIEAMSTQGYKGFSIFPVDASASNGLFEQLRRRGQFVVAFGAEPALPTPASFTVATHIQGAAEAATEDLIRRMGGRGRILNVLETVTDINTQKRDAGIRAVVARNPQVSIVQTISDMSQLGEATTKIQSALAARSGEIEGIIATGYTPTVAIAAILTEWHKDPSHGRIRFVGIDTDPIVLKAIQEGAIDATLAQNTYAHGAVPVAILKLMVERWTPRQPYQFIDSGWVIVDQSNLQTYSAAVRAQADQILSDLKTKYLSPPLEN